MRKVISYAFFFILICYSTSNLQALPSSEYPTTDKSFKKGRIDQVIIDEQGVFLLIDGFWFGSQGMHATSDGIFVLENGEWMPLSEAIQLGNSYVWQCRNCKTWNAEGTNRCYQCKRNRGG